MKERVWKRVERRLEMSTVANSLRVYFSCVVREMISTLLVSLSVHRSKISATYWTEGVCIPSERQEQGEPPPFLLLALEEESLHLLFFRRPRWTQEDAFSEVSLHAPGFFLRPRYLMVLLQFS